MLVKEHKEFVITRQLLKSGTAIGALVREAEYAASKPDFINKLTVALKEANETEYWLNLLKDTGYLDESKFESLSMECNQLISIMVSSLKTLKSKITS
jgi:four helix bundle protein